MNNLLRVKDICTTEIVYFDRQYEEDCLKFCLQRDINCMPSAVNDDQYYHRQGSLFEVKEVEPERRVKSETYIFAPWLLERFVKYDLLFVYEGGVLTGVVHYSDYNREAVSIYLYSLISAFERELRKLLICKGFSRESLKRGNGKNNNGLSHEFEKINLSELINFARARGILSFHPHINNLRNQVMHSDDVVDKKNIYSEDLIYREDTFVSFFKNALGLVEDLKKIKTRILFENHEGL